MATTHGSLRLPSILIARGITLMKHAGDQAVDALAPLLVRIRQIDGMQERKHGIFYWRASAFLHFHEDPAGFFGDMKVAGDFRRFPLNTSAERAAFVAAARATVERGAARSGRRRAKG